MDQPQNGAIKESYVLHILVGAVGVLIMGLVAYYTQTSVATMAAQASRISSLENEFATVNANIELLCFAQKLPCRQSN